MLNVFHISTQASAGYGGSATPQMHTMVSRRRAQPQPITTPANKQRGHLPPPVTYSSYVSIEPTEMLSDSQRFIYSKRQSSLI